MLTNIDLKNNTLIEMEKLLQSNNKSLFDFLPMHIPNISSISQSQNHLICDELNYDNNSLQTKQNQLLSTVTPLNVDFSVTLTLPHFTQ